MKTTLDFSSKAKKTVIMLTREERGSTILHRCDISGAKPSKEVILYAIEQLSGELGINLRIDINKKKFLGIF